jgi:CRP-like cAMP-binding protein
MLTASHPLENHLLAALPEAERSRLLPHLESVDMEAGKALYESGSRLNYVHFPTSAIVSMLYVMEDGASAEIAVVGNEGMVGVALLMGSGSMTNRAVVQNSGAGYRIKANVIVDEFNRGGAALKLMLRYAQVLSTHTAQTAACNRHHSLDQQLCRWLLLSLDRLDSNEILITQETIANLLGVRREGVTGAAGRLQLAGAIRYRRGRIEVIDRAALEQRACECYAVVRNEYCRLLPSLHIAPLAPRPTVTPLFERYGMISERPHAPPLRRFA